MAFFKDLGKKISEGVQDASEKAAELVEVNKLNFAISKEKNAIDEAKRQIGDKIFAMYQTGQTIPDTLTDELTSIGSHLQAIAGFEAKLSEIKSGPGGQKAETMAADTSTPAETVPSSETVRFCGNCGAALAEGSMFCGECGQKTQ